MSVTINWGTRRIYVPKSFMTLVQTVPFEIYNLDLNDFRLALKSLEDSADGMIFPDTHRHNTTVILGGVTFARLIEIINDYTIEFENGNYAVNLVGANSNVADKSILNQVSIRAANSAGLVEGAATGISMSDITAIKSAIESSTVLSKETTVKKTLNAALASL
jgi:hypothetical protein